MSRNGTEAVGARLKRLRLQRNFSQRDLSSPGVSYAYISRIEAGARTPSVKALRKLAEKLGVTVEYLEHGNEGTITDALLAELAAAASKPPRVTIGLGRTFLRCEVRDSTISVVRPSLTEALIEVLTKVREAEQLRNAAEQLDARAREIEWEMR